MPFTRLDRFVAKAKTYGASFIYAPEVATDPLKNQGTTVLPNGTLQGNAKLVVPGLISGAAALELDGVGDYVDTEWTRAFPAAVTFVWVGKRASAVTEDAICSTSPGEDLFLSFSPESHIHFTANAWVTTSDWNTSAIGANAHFGALVWKVGTSATLYTALLGGELVSWGTLANAGKPGGARELFISDDAFAAFIGQLLPFAMFDRELNVEEIDELRRIVNGTNSVVPVTRSAA